jgi:HlyD family secretion protein
MRQLEGRVKRNAGNLRGQAKWFAVASAAVVGVIGVGVWGFWHQQRAEGPQGLENGQGAFAVRRGDLTISVTESGDIKAVKSTDVKCEVEGRTAIVNIVPEGTSITAEDVKNGKVLVELDSSKLKESLAQRQIELATAEASQAEAKEAYEIQVKQNESDVTAAQLKGRFALIDMQKYVGEPIADRLVKGPRPGAASRATIVSLLADPNRLGGEAKQKLRELAGAITLAESNLQNAIFTLEWTEKLHKERYAAETELQRDRLNKQRLEVDQEKAQIAQDLFLRYEFPKQVEKFLSDYEEARRDLERTEARARSQLAQAKAKLTSADATLTLQKDRLAKVEKQLAACVIKAPSVGQVVYWSSTERWSDVKIEQGAEVSEGRKIITIPDASEMKVEIKVHETWIDKIAVGQPARITVAAFPGQVFTGRVLKKAPLADLDNWLNPDLKAYVTDVGIEGAHDALKTGMTGKVEITIQELHGVLYVPIQSVVSVGETKACYVPGSGPEKRPVQTGLFNDNFVEIKSGLEEGEQVLLNPPRWSEEPKTPEKTGPAPAAGAPAESK